MLFVADIGNTNISAGVFEEKLIVKTWNLSTDKNKTDDEYGIFLRNIINLSNMENKLTAAVISSVVMPLTEKFKTAVEKYLNIPVLVVSHKTNTGIILDVENPKEVGCDRIANACAAYCLYKTPAVVVDFGTATNFDVISGDGRFLGGAIAPGIKMSAESFSHFTNLLPKLKIENAGSVIGKNTVQNMLSGIIIGHAAMIDGLAERISLELKEPVTLIATGGFSSMISVHLKKPFDYINPNLTLEGLRIIYEFNQCPCDFQPSSGKTYNKL